MAHSLSLGHVLRVWLTATNPVTRPEPVREALEVHLVSLVEGGHRRLLDDLVFQGRTQRYDRWYALLQEELDDAGNLGET